MSAPANLFGNLRTLTPSRVGVATADGTAPTRSVLDFQQAYALARDAIHEPLDAAGIARAVAPLPSRLVRSQTPDRGTYLRRPDLGRRLHAECLIDLPAIGCDVVFVVADGLSARAVEQHVAPVLKLAVERLEGWSVGPVVIASQARVAIGDEIGACLGAEFCVVLIGERPGLSVSDSLGVYITRKPAIGRMDSDRNCISNIHANGGLSHAQAAAKIAWLLKQARKIGQTGVTLKDEMVEGVIEHGAVSTGIDGYGFST